MATVADKVSTMFMEDYVDAANESTSTNHRKQREDDLFIIGAGFARTGTSSLQAALAKLGFRCHHMREIMRDTTGYQLNEWYKAGKMKYDLKQKHHIQSFKVDEENWAKCTIDYDWNRIFNPPATDYRYNGVVDFPGAAFYVELMKYYPNHKVILSVRDSAEQWYTSCDKTIFAMNRVSTFSWFWRLFGWLRFGESVKMGLYCIFYLLLDNKINDKQYQMQVYEDWIEAVKEYVPKDKLLVFNVKQGWKPLCEFLEIDDVPNEPFPRSNEAHILQDAAKKMYAVKVITDVLLIGVVGGLSYFGYRYFVRKQ